MKNYYEILNVDINTPLNEIQMSYNNKIKQFNNLPFLTDNMKVIIKELKEAKYILLDDERREKYNTLLYGINEENNDEDINIEEDIDRENIINQVNTHIPKIDQRTLPLLKDKNEVSNTEICDRIFNIKFN
jgi:DnaJ-class molecular chaperone